MEDDKQFLINQFSGIVFENNIKTILNPFEEMMCLLEENNIFKFQSHFRNLRSVFGRAFTERAVVNFFVFLLQYIYLRNSS